MMRNYVYPRPKARPWEWRFWRRLWTLTKQHFGLAPLPHIDPRNDAHGGLSDEEYEAGFNDGPDNPCWGIPKGAQPLYEPLTGVLIGYRMNSENFKVNPAKIARPY